MTASEQTTILANYIMTNIPDEPSRNEGAGECAVRIIESYRIAMDKAIHEISVYPANVANAYDILVEALGEKKI